MNNNQFPGNIEISLFKIQEKRKLRLKKLGRFEENVEFIFRLKCECLQYKLATLVSLKTLSKKSRLR